MRKTGVYRDRLFLEHDPGISHPESAQRLQVIYEALDQGNTAVSSDSSDSSDYFIFPKFSPVATDILQLNHSASLIKQVAATQGQSHNYLDADTQTSARSYEAACLAAGALVDGVARIEQGELDNAFCLVRPPGHHAEQDRAMGFCLFNNVALAAHWAIQELGMQRILIFDWDLHHGNGTQNSFYDTDKVFYISSHQYPFYPGTGFFVETGNSVGAGYTLNIPLSGGAGDMEYARIVNELVLPVARSYKPELILISCGFDIYDGDPLGGMQVTTAGFAWMTRQMLSVAEEVCNGKLLVTLEGGYNLTAMRDGSLAVLAELCQENKERLAWSYPMYLSDEQAAQFAISSVPCPALDHALQIVKMSGWA